MAAIHYKYEKLDASAYFNGQRYTTYHTDEEEEGEESANTKVIRVFLVGLLLGVIIFSTTNLVMMLIKVELPAIQINSLRTSNFQANDTHLAANWDANFTVVNPDNRLGITIADFYVILYYKEFELATTSLKPFLPLEPNKDAPIKVIMEREDLKNIQDLKFELPYKEIYTAANSTKMVNFNMQVIVSAIVMSNTWWERKSSFAFSCNDLNVRFASETSGAVVFNHGRTCFHLFG